MKKYIFLFFPLILSLPLIAQLEIKEGSFKEVPGFVNINTDKMYDDNDRPYAVLKIKTENLNSKQRRELNFGGDAQTFFEVEYQDGEVWLYISYYASFIKISHDDFSSTEFYFPFDMKPKCGYELTLINKFNYNPVPEKPQNNYLIVKSDQQNALIYFDDSFVGMKECSKLYKVGERHKWRIECDLYYTEYGEVDIVSGEPIVVDKILRPSFGYINVKSSPENGAIVFIDGIKLGTTPYKSDKIKSGQHSIRIVKEMFNADEQTVVVEDGKTNNVELKMTAYYASVKVVTDSQADIYIDNECKGTGTWKGRLTEGEHVFEARKTSHNTSTVYARLVLGNNDDIVIPNPEPIYGTLDVSTTPMGAAIIIDGKNYGTTPRVLTEVLIGKHHVKITKNGYQNIEKTIIIDEKKSFKLYEKLQVKQQKINPKRIKRFDDYSFFSFDIGYVSQKESLFGFTYGILKNRHGWFLNTNISDRTNDIIESTYLNCVVGYIFRINNSWAIRSGGGIKIGFYDSTKPVISIGNQYKIGKVLILSFDVSRSNFYEFKLGIGIKDLF